MNPLNPPDFIPPYDEFINYSLRSIKNHEHVKCDIRIL